VSDGRKHQEESLITFSERKDHNKKSFVISREGQHLSEKVKIEKKQSKEGQNWEKK